MIPLGRTPSSLSTTGAWATLLKLDEGAEAPKDVEREIWLWDFAGQADYRLIHLLYMDETALALLVFNPQEEDPFEGLAQWDRDLTRAARGKPFLKRLVAGRCDVARPPHSARPTWRRASSGAAPRATAS